MEEKQCLNTIQFQQTKYIFETPEEPLSQEALDSLKEDLKNG